MDEKDKLFFKVCLYVLVILLLLGLGWAMCLQVGLVYLAKYFMVCTIGGIVLSFLAIFCCVLEK